MLFLFVEFVKSFSSVERIKRNIDDSHLEIKSSNMQVSP